MMKLGEVKFDEVREKYGICESYYVKLGQQAEGLLDFLLAIRDSTYAVILVTPQFIARCVIGLLCICQVSVERVVEFFDSVLFYHVSKGRVGNIAEEKSKIAAEIMGGVSLENIKNTAADETFQQGKPIAVVVDLDTHFVPLLKPMRDRTGKTWEEICNELKNRAFHPHLCVSDAGSGLLKGIPSAFPGITMQLDVFHVLRDVGVYARRQERRAFSELSELCKLEYKVNSSKIRTKTKKRYEELLSSIDDTLLKADTLHILLEWLRELTGFSGYGYALSFSLCIWILDEMAALYPDNKKYQYAISQFRERLPDTLKFLRRFQENLRDASIGLGIDEHDMMLLYNQSAYPPYSKEYAAIEKRLYKRLGSRLIDARAALPDIIRTTYRASSMIENVNSRIRCYINLKREIPERFMPLLCLYLNTRKAIRPKNKNWVGTSALDRLTGHENPAFLDLLFGEPDYLIHV